MTEHYRSPPFSPAPDIALVVHAGERYRDETPAATIVTARDGTFTANLPAGRYCITIADSKGPQPPPPPVPFIPPTPASHHDEWTDPVCAVAEWERCDAIADVPVAKPVAIDISGHCRPPCTRGGSPPP